MNYEMFFSTVLLLFWKVWKKSARGLWTSQFIRNFTCPKDKLTFWEKVFEEIQIKEVLSETKFLN